jgi:hypothetical protein
VCPAFRVAAPEFVPKRFITWSTTSQCAEVADEFNTWGWRRDCIVGLLSAASITGRQALIDSVLGHVYNVNHLKRWYAVASDRPPLTSMTPSHTSCNCSHHRRTNGCHLTLSTHNLPLVHVRFPLSTSDEATAAAVLEAGGDLATAAEAAPVIQATALAQSPTDAVTTSSEEVQYCVCVCGAHLHECSPFC